MKTTLYQRPLFVTFLIVAAAAMSASLSASIMNNGDFTGTNFTFQMVTENSDPETSLYYTSFATSADTLLVDPSGFGLQTDANPDNETLSSTLSMMVVPNAANGSVDKLTYFEEGDATIVGNGSVNVDLPYEWSIVEVDGNAVTPAITGSGNGAYTLGANGIWEAQFEVDLALLLNAFELERSTEYGTRITKANLSVTNSLTATADASPTSLAFIKKKNVLGGIQVTVPEPATISWVAWLPAALLLRRKTR